MTVNGSVEWQCRLGLVAPSVEPEGDGDALQPLLRERLDIAQGDTLERPRPDPLLLNY